MGIKSLSHSAAAKKATDVGRIMWVKTEIKSLYARKQMLYNSADKLHLEISNYNCEEVREQSRIKFLSRLKYKKGTKQKVLTKKLDKLIREKNDQWKNNTERKEGHVFYNRTKNLTQM